MDDDCAPRGAVRLRVRCRLINLPFAKDLHFLEHWLEPSLFGHEAELAVSGATKWGLGVVAVAVGLVAIVSAFAVYLRGRGDPANIERDVLAEGWHRRFELRSVLRWPRPTPVRPGSLV